jgi:hypothetical protein
MTSLATYLEGLLHSLAPRATTAHFLTYFRSKSYVSDYAAVRAALEALMIPRAAVSESLPMAAEILGLSDGDDVHMASLSARKDLEICLRAAKGDVGTAIDLTGVLDEVKSWETNNDQHWAESVGRASVENELPAQGTFHTGPQAPTAPARQLRAFPPSPQKGDFGQVYRKPVHPQNWRTVAKPNAKKRLFDHPLAEFIPSYSRGTLPHDATPGSLFSEPVNDVGSQPDFDLISCRRRAAEERRKREDAMRQAGKYFKTSGGPGPSKSVAAYYAAEARKFETSARMWELRAARELVKQQRWVALSSSIDLWNPLAECEDLITSSQQDQFCIDIHHLTLAEATTVVLESVAKWHASQNSGKSLLRT